MTTVTSGLELAAPPLARRRQSRLAWLSATLVAGWLAVALGLVRFQMHWAEPYRLAAARPLERTSPIPAPRGRILSRDGAVLAVDREIHVLALDYRWLESPPQADWVRRQARQRLSRDERRDPAQVRAAEEKLLAERIELHRRLAALCGLSNQEWTQRTLRVQRRVERIVDDVNRRSALRQGSTPPTAGGAQRLAAWLLRQGWLPTNPRPATPRAAERIVVREELTDHPLVDEVSWTVVAEVASHPDRYPGVRLRATTRRTYPQGNRAAQLVGYVGRNPMDAGDRASDGQRPAGSAVPRELAAWQGLSGIERLGQLELASQPGQLVERHDRGGQTLSQTRAIEPRLGRDLTLSIDARLQQTAEQLLDQALARRWPDRSGARPSPAGGAVLALDVRTGAVLVAATAPRFDPNRFVERNAEGLSDLLTDPRRPLFDRSLGMALPPGCLMQLVVAVAALESGQIDAWATVNCEGFWGHPDRWPCPLFAQQGRAHGQLNLVEALSQDCRTYFLLAARAAGPQELVPWARRLGLGRASGSELPGEASGQLPGLTSAWTQADLAAFASGQGQLLITPLQAVRLAAAVANGGRLVRPQWVVDQLGEPRDRSSRAGEPAPDISNQSQSTGLSAATLQALRQALARAVRDPQGPIHRASYVETVSLAGMAASPSSGQSHPPHAWYLGYAPLESPRVAFAVAIEHGGSAATTAAPLARLLAERMAELGYLSAVASP